MDTAEMRASRLPIPAPTLAVDPLVVGGVVGGLLAAAGVSIALSAALAGRADVAHQLRIGEDR